jgi:hypothetical protein
MYFVLFFFILLPFSGQQKIRHTGGGREYGRKNAQLIFSHSDYTAGFGIAPNLSIHGVPWIGSRTLPPIRNFTLPRKHHIYYMDILSLKYHFVT